MFYFKESIKHVSPGNSKRSSEVDIQQKVLIMRHGERVDLSFRHWIPSCFDSDGKYIRKDLNMPKTIPQRTLGMKGFINDSPLTNLGKLQAKLTGEALNDANLTINFAYSSPSLRCVETCHGVLTGLGLQQSVAIRLEPGLFEWLFWYYDEQPDWMLPEELIEAGFNIDVSYVPTITKDEMFSVEETCDQFYNRNNDTVTKILSGCTAGNIILVGHASSLEVCTRQLVGFQPRTFNEMIKIVDKVSYCSMVALEKRAKKWHIVKPPCPPMINSENRSFDWTTLI